MKPSTILGFVIIALCASAIFVFANNLSFSEQNPAIENVSTGMPDETVALVKNVTEAKLATRINNQAIQRDVDTNMYLARYGNFSKVSFKKVEKISEKMSFKIDRTKKNFNGLIIDNKKYVFDMMGCYNDICYARINGQPMKLTQGMNISLEDGNTVYVKTARSDVCDRKPVCDMLYDSYDLVELELKRGEK
jgi:hypothetical protein